MRGQSYKQSLSYFAKEGNLAEVNRLIAAKVDVDALTLDEYNSPDERTPLLHAALKGHKEIVKALIDAGANVNAVGDRDYTALYLAASNGHTESFNISCCSSRNVRL